MHSNVTIKNVSWPHFSWTTLYRLLVFCSVTLWLINKWWWWWWCETADAVRWQSINWNLWLSLRPSPTPWRPVLAGLRRTPETTTQPSRAMTDQLRARKNASNSANDTLLYTSTSHLSMSQPCDLALTLFDVDMTYSNDFFPSAYKIYSSLYIFRVLKLFHGVVSCTKIK